MWNVWKSVEPCAESVEVWKQVVANSFYWYSWILARAMLYTFPHLFRTCSHLFCICAAPLKPYKNHFELNAWLCVSPRSASYNRRATRVHPTTSKATSPLITREKISPNRLMHMTSQLFLMFLQTQGAERSFASHKFWIWIQQRSCTSLV